MRLRNLGWPVVGQILAAGFAALSATLIYVWLDADRVITYFSTVAMVTICGAFGAFGQRRVLPRDIREATGRDEDVPSVVRSRLILIGRASIVAATVCVALLLLLGMVDESDRWPIVVICAAWVVGESFRGVLADGQLGFKNDRNAASTGDALRWVLHSLGVLAVARTASVTALIAAGAAASWITLAAAGWLLHRELGRIESSAPASLSSGAVRSGFIVAVNSLAVMMTTQLTTVTADLGLEDEAAADFSFGMRIAAGLAILQAGTAKFVLPRAVGMGDGNDARGLHRDILKITWLSTAIAGLALAGLVFLLLVVQRSFTNLTLIALLVGLGMVANVAAGPAGTVLIANRQEMVVLRSNVTFGTLAAMAPLLGWWDVDVIWIAAAVGVAIAMHHGANAAILVRRLGPRVGLWRLYLPGAAGAKVAGHG